MQYNPEEIDPRATYGLQISITLNDRLMMVNTPSLHIVAIWTRAVAFAVS